MSRVGAQEGKAKGRGPFKSKKWVRGKGKDKSGAKRKRGADEDDDEKDDKEITDRYYKPQEYAQLTAAQRAKIHKLQDERQRSVATTLTGMQVKLNQLEAAAGAQQDADDGSDDGKPPAQTNRKNPALNRKSRST